MDELDVNPRILQALRKAGIRDFKSLFHLSPSEVEKSARLGTQDVANLFKAVALALPAPEAISVLNLKNREDTHRDSFRSLTTGCKVLDAFLKGGIRSQVITEVAGQSAAGKTQLCMQLCLTCQFPRSLGGLNGAAVYLCTEDVFPNKRLAQMVSLLQSRTSDPILSKIKFMDNVLIQHAADLDVLRSCIFHRLPRVLSQGRVKLVVVDSIAALFRSEFTSNQMMDRAKQLTAFGAQLRKLAQQHNIPIVCVNQVSDLIGSEPVRGRAPTQGNTRMTPALGLAWATMVSTRLMLTRSPQHLLYTPKATNSTPGRDPYEVNVRWMEVLFSPYLPNTICRYIIDEEGVKGLP